MTPGTPDNIAPHHGKAVPLKALPEHSKQADDAELDERERELQAIYERPEAFYRDINDD
jgi:hypothetical protein